MKLNTSDLSTDDTSEAPAFGLTLPLPSVLSHREGSVFVCLVLVCMWAGGYNSIMWLDTELFCLYTKTRCVPVIALLYYYYYYYFLCP